MGELAGRIPDLVVSLSATTRPRRAGEVDGVDYRFMDDRTFDELVAADGFLEWAEFGGHRYGTPWASVREPLAEGNPVVLEIDVQGALQVRQRFADAVLIFLRPPSLDTLRQRLRERGTNDSDRISDRMEIARDELAQAERFDHVVVNDRLEAAVDRIARILTETPAI